jgi:hypothetical protein
MRSDEWLFFICLMATGLLLGYTLIVMFQMNLIEQVWLLLAGWIGVSALQWIMFLLNVSYRRVVR